MGKLPIGLQLYSVREDAQRDLSGTLQKVKEIGYDFVELAGLYGNTPTQMKAALEAAGLYALSAHIPLAELLENPEQVIADYCAIGCRFLVIPYLPEELRPPGAGFDRVLESIPMLGEICNRNGAVLLYHNHDFEFVRMPDGRYALDALYETIPAELLQTELDCCWIKVSGEEPVAYLERYAGRCPIVHLKDFYKQGNPRNLYELIGVEQTEEDQKENGVFEFRPVGFGMQVMPEILDAALRNGAQYLVVEQDASVGRTPMDAVTMSRRYLELLGF